MHVRNALQCISKRLSSQSHDHMMTVEPVPIQITVEFCSIVLLVVLGLVLLSMHFTKLQIDGLHKRVTYLEMYSDEEDSDTEDDSQHIHEMLTEVLQTQKAIVQKMSYVPVPDDDCVLVK
jgi:hypothetical protein